MLGLSLSPELEDEAPGQGCHVAVNLRIEEVAAAYQASGKGYSDAEPVHYPQEIKAVLPAVMAGEPPHRKQQGHCASVTRQASLPGHEYFGEAAPGPQIVLGFIEEAVTEPCADYRSNKQGVKKRVKQFLVYVLLSEEVDFK